MEIRSEISPDFDVLVTKRKGGVCMTKLRTFNNRSKASAAYLVGLCKIARDFNLSTKSSYVEDFANTDSLWIQNLREQTTLMDDPLSKWRKFKIGVAIAFFGDELPWLTNAKLGLADDLVAAQSLIASYKLQEENCRFLTSAVAKEQTKFVGMAKRRSDYTFWRDDVLKASAQCDKVRSDIVVACREARDAISHIRRIIASQAYGEKSVNVLEKIDRNSDDCNFLMPCVRIRQTVAPCRRQIRGTFQYQLLQIEYNASEHIATLLAKLSELDTEYQKILHGRESEAH